MARPYNDESENSDGDEDFSAYLRSIPGVSIETKPIINAVLEVLYTEEISFYRPDTWKMGLELLNAAAFFIIPKAESIARNYIRSHMLIVGLLRQKSMIAMEMLTAAVEFPEVEASGGNEADDFLGQLVSYIGPDWFPYELSRSAVECILARSQSFVRADEEDEPFMEDSMEEYVKFRNIILWHVHQLMRMGDVSAREAAHAHFALPGRDALTPWQRNVPAKNYTGIDEYISCGSAGKLDFLGSNADCMVSLQQMLQHVNFSRVPAEMLLKVVHPLSSRVVPRQQVGQQLLKADYAEFCDVTFRCSDGIVVSGYRSLLASRCAVFKCMFENGMLETEAAAEIPLPLFSSPIINAVLEVLYTEEISFYRPDTWKMGLELLSAAAFFIIPEAESIARNYIQSHMLIVGLLRQKSMIAMEMLTAAVEFPEVEASGGNEADDFLGQLVSYVGPDWFPYELSRSAVECILARSQSVVRADEEDEPFMEDSMEEYVKFRNIILWHVHQLMRMGEISAREAAHAHFALPGRDALTPWQRNVPAKIYTVSDIDEYVSQIWNSTNSSGGAGKLDFLGSNADCMVSLQQMLQDVNFLRIPAEMLLKLVHPLGSRVVPPQQLLTAVIQQGLQNQRRMMPFMSRPYWMHDSRIETSSDGCLAHELAYNDHGDNSVCATAIAIIPMFRMGGACKWSVSILEHGEHEIEIGFVCRPAGYIRGHILEKGEMLRSTLTSTPSAKMFRIRTSPHKELVDILRAGLYIPDAIDTYGGKIRRSQARMHVGTPICFDLDQSGKTCHVRFGMWETVLDELPDGECFPAVSFMRWGTGSPNCARVQLRLGNGSDPCVLQSGRVKVDLASWIRDSSNASITVRMDRRSNVKRELSTDMGERQERGKQQRTE